MIIWHYLEVKTGKILLDQSEYCTQVSDKYVGASGHPTSTPMMPDQVYEEEDL